MDERLHLLPGFGDTSNITEVPCFTMILLLSLLLPVHVAVLVLATVVGAAA
jgi:hypothetical protein